MPINDFSPEALFQQSATHVWAGHPGGALPPQKFDEVAAIGRSNVGKSSLINALLRRNGLARSSNTPGRTRAIHFFNIGEVFYFVDLPGYGYAKMSKQESAEIADYVSDYLRERRALRLMLVLVDVRHGLKDSDRDMLRHLIAMGVPAQVVLTKCDKLNINAAKAMQQKVQDELDGYVGLAGPAVAVSSEKGFGIPELRELIYNALQQ